MPAAGRMKWREEETANPLEGNAALFEAALEAFSEKSFGEASLNDIIKAAGLNKGSFYYRFYDKMDLYLSLLYRLGMEKLKLFERYDHENAAEGFFESIKDKAILGLRFARMEPRYNALSRRMLTENETFRNVIRSCFGDMTQDVLSAMIQEGKAKGQIDASVSTHLATAVFATLLTQIDLMISPNMDDQAILAQVDELIAILKHGMCTNSAAPKDESGR